jgi:hypothetical protein
LRASRFKVYLLGLLLLAALAGSACSRSTSEASETVGSIARIQGSVNLVREGATRPAAEDEELLAGDEIRVDSTGSVTFRMGASTDLELVKGAALLRRSNVIRLSDATLVVSSDEPVEMDFETVRVAFQSGAVRVELPAPGRIASYEVQDLQVTSGTQAIPLPQLWQASVAEDGTLGQAQPLQFSRDDEIDAAHLAHALEADSKLGNLLRGVEPQLAARDGSALRRRLGDAGIGPESLARFEPATSADQLMGLAFAREWKRDVPDETAKGFEQAMALKVLGASWGLVAQNFDVGPDALVAGLQAEINAVLFPDGVDEGGSLVPAPAPSPTRAPSRTPGTGGTGQPAPAPPPAPAPGTPAPSPTAPGLLEPVIDPLRPLLPNELEAIIDELYGLVHGLVPLV